MAGPDPLPVTVPASLHAAVADAVSADFAASYLCGAVLMAGALHPRTETARRRLQSTVAAFMALNAAGVSLAEAIAPEDRMAIATDPAANAAPKHAPERRIRR